VIAAVILGTLRHRVASAPEVRMPLALLAGSLDGRRGPHSSLAGVWTLILTSRNRRILVS